MPSIPRAILVGAFGGLLLAGCAQRPVSRTPPPSSTAEPTGVTGIAVCDEYLSSYLACHRAAKLYPPDQLPSRYAAMRSILLKDSADPHVRPQLAARCQSLSNQLLQALQGKSCTEQPAPATSTR
ncbi:MAG: hypothetical protein ABIQ36_01670 [Rhodanobacter sp.]